MDMDLLLTNARLADGRSGMAIVVQDGRIAAIHGPGTAPPTATARETIDLHGDLVLPALVDGHIHLDKTLFGLPWWPHQAEPTRASRIATDQRVLPTLPLDTEARARTLLRRCVAFGTGHLRTHADITPAFGLDALHGVLRAKEAHAHAVTVQTVAFPQVGVVGPGPAVVELLDAAVREGADLVGGIDPCEVDRDPRGQLDAIFAVADRRGVGLDIHLHEPGELGLFSLQEICARTKAFGMQGQVTVSHGFALGGLLEAKQAAAIALMAESQVGLVSHGAGGATLPPLFRLRAAGVPVFCGNDNVRDTWTPHGTGDMLERAAIIGWRADVRHDPLLDELFDMVCGAGAKALGQHGHGVAAGCAANFFTIAADGVPEAIAQHPGRTRVFFKGRLVARDGAWVGN